MKHWMNIIFRQHVLGWGNISNQRLVEVHGHSVRSLRQNSGVINPKQLKTHAVLDPGSPERALYLHDLLRLDMTQMTALIQFDSHVFDGRTKSISRLVQNEHHARVGPKMTQSSKRASGE